MMLTKDLTDECEQILAVKDQERKIEKLVIFFQKIESELCKQQNREQVNISVEIPNQRSGKVYQPYYDRENKEIKLFITGNKSAIEYLMSYIHEAEHAKQHLSRDNNKIINFMYRISDVLYIEPSHARNDSSMPVEYYWNYKEVEAKLAEMKELLNIYYKTKENNKTLSLEEGKKFRLLFNDACNYMKLVNINGMNNIIKSNNQRISKYPELLKSKNINVLKTKVFLKVVAPLMYMQLQNKVSPIRNEILKIQQELDNAYNKNIGATIDILNAQNENKKKDIEQAISSLHNHHKMSDFVDANIGITQDIDGFDNFKQMLEHLQNDKNVKEIFAMENIDGDYYRIVYSLYKSEANEILNENHIPEIKTQHDEVDIEK